MENNEKYHAQMLVQTQPPIIYNYEANYYSITTFAHYFNKVGNYGVK